MALPPPLLWALHPLSNVHRFMGSMSQWATPPRHSMSARFFTLHTSHFRRHGSSFSSVDVKSKSLDVAMERIRNLGVIAHIDAGKTTTTERMLFYSQKIRTLGDVDHGDTTMDYLEEERKRGITIQSACITFNWREHKLNLIDTPGHVDFTVEVERCLRVLDGAVGVFDAVKGVQAQSETVWRQADRYSVPRIVFVNKMDREGASFTGCVQSIRSRLGVHTLVIHAPIGEGAEFKAVIDLVDMSVVTYDFVKDPHGGMYDRTDIRNIPRGSASEGLVPPSLTEHVSTLRKQLVEQVAELDDEVGDLYLQYDGDTDIETVSPAVLRRALRRITIAMRGCVVLCGSSLKNRNVQLLLDAIVDYLPSPADRGGIFIDKDSANNVSNHMDIIRSPSGKDPFCALAFKVAFDHQKGYVVFVRVFSGILKVKDTLLNVNASQVNVNRLEHVVPANRKKGVESSSAEPSLSSSSSSLSSSLSSSPPSSKKGRIGGATDVKEKVFRLLEVSADATTDISEIPAGNIGAVVGLKNTFTGDTLIHAVASGNVNASGNDRFMLPGITVPEPVFFCSIEAPTQAQQENLETALRHLVMDDPSMRVMQDVESGQTLLKGMGELHLEVFHSRIRSEFKIDAELGKMRVSFRESITGVVTQTHVQHMLTGMVASGTIGGTTSGSGPFAQLTLELSPMAIRKEEGSKGNTFSVEIGGVSDRTVRGSNGSSAQMRVFTEGVETAIRHGVEIGLSKGPLMANPVMDVHVKVTDFSYSVSASGGGPNAKALTNTSGAGGEIPLHLWQACASQCIAKGLSATEAGVCLMEPVMNAEIAVPAEYIGPVISDIASKRRGNVREIVAPSAFSPPSSSTPEEKSPPVSLLPSTLMTSPSTATAGNQVIFCEVPLAEMAGYATALRSVTQGSGSFSMEFAEFREVPSHVRDKLIKNTWGMM